MAEENKSAPKQSKKPAAPKKEAPKPAAKKTAPKAEPKQSSIIGKRVLLFTGREFIVKEEKSPDVFILKRPNKEKEYIFNRQDFKILD